MFNLEQSIADWRRQMLAAGIKSPATLDELESHLRQDIKALVSAGKPEAEAFQAAMLRLGNADAVRTEFNKIKSPMIWPVKIGYWLWIVATIGLGAFLSPRFIEKREFLMVGHTVALTAGYFAALLAGSLGICYVCYRASHTLSPVRQQSLSRAVSLFNHFAVGFMLGGMMLGMAWSRLHLGRFLGAAGQREPFEIGGWCVCVWFIASTAMQRRIRERAAMLMCIGGGAVVSLAWFGTGMVAIHLGMRGAVMEYCWLLAFFLGIHLCFLILGLRPDAETAES